MIKGKPGPYASNAPGLTETDRQSQEREIVEFDSDDKYVKSILLISSSAKQVRFVSQCKVAKEILDKLSSLHEESVASSL